MIGCLGDIAFTVSASVVRTLDNFQWSGSARYAAHQRHLGRGLLEFTGMDPDKISFDMTLSTQLGASPSREISKIVFTGCSSSLFSQATSSSTPRPKTSARGSSSVTSG